MEVPVLVAQIAGLAYLSMGVGFLFGGVTYKSIADSFEKSPGLTIMTGMMSIIIGMLILASHNAWVKDWTVLVTIIGWGAVIKGCVFLAFPQLMTCCKKACKCDKGMGVLVLLIGLVLGYYGFVA